MVTRAAPVAALATARHWLALWLGWLAMGQLGSVMAWSWFSGLAGMVAWWCWLQWAPLRWHPRTVASRQAWALLAVAGLAAVMLAGRHQALGWLGWALAIAAWAQTVLGLRHAACTTALRLGWAQAGLGLLLAWLVAAVAADPAQWPRQWPLAAGLLLLAAWPVRGPQATAPGQALPPTVDRMPAVAQAATLLMMGSLPLMGQWCLANGQSVLVGTAVHLWAMAWASGLTQALLGHSPHLPLRTRRGLGQWLLLNAAALAWLGTGLWQMALAMALLAAAGTLWHAPANGPDHPAPVHHPISARGWLAPWPAALALLWLGHAAPTQGPQALSWALAGLAVLAVLDRQGQHGSARGGSAATGTGAPPLQPQPSGMP